VELRRVVTGVDGEGRSRIVSDGRPPRTHEFEHVPLHASSILWCSDDPAAPADGADPTPAMPSIVRGPGATTLLQVQLPPDSVWAAEDFDAERALAEQSEATPGLLEHFEEGSAFHATPTIDYIVLLEGELWLLLDEGETVVRPGDVVIQNGTRHAWENRAEVPATFLCVLVSARR
jgi:mannose-6-phosphate isomerase-like protein (cupin superfamily)